MTRHVLLVSCIFLLVAINGCNRQRSEAGDAEKSPALHDSICYLFAQNRDTIALSLVSHEGIVRGNLGFLFYEKDKSTGTIEGEMKGDTLVAGYEFTSEGTLSFRQVAFLRRDSFLVMGSGEILNTGNREVFKDPKQIDFTAGVVLREMPCR
jgi:hypothetical protein